MATIRKALQTGWIQLSVGLVLSICGFMIITAPMSVAATKPPPQATEREKLMLEESDDAQTMAAVYRRLGIGLTVKWAGIALMCIGAGRRRAIRRARLDAGLSASGA